MATKSTIAMLRKVDTEQSLRRRLALMGLGLSPADLRRVTGLRPKPLSGVLSGWSSLNQEQAAAVGRLAAKRARLLFTLRPTKH